MKKTCGCCKLIRNRLDLLLQICEHTKVSVTWAHARIDLLDTNYTDHNLKGVSFFSYGLYFKTDVIYLSDEGMDKWTYETQPQGPGGPTKAKEDTKRYLQRNVFKHQTSVMQNNPTQKHCQSSTNTFEVAE